MKAYPNMATRIFEDYCEEAKINTSYNLEQLKKHAGLLAVESKNAHPFMGSCTQAIVNNIDWDFIRKSMDDEAR